MKCHARFRNHTPTVQSSTGPQKLRTSPVVAVHGQGTVHINTAGVLKFHLCKSGPHVLKCHARFQNRRPTSADAGALPSLCTQPMAAVLLTPSGNCSHTYGGCTKMLFVPEWTLWRCEVPYLFAESYKYSSWLCKSSQTDGDHLNDLVSTGYCRRATRRV